MRPDPPTSRVRLRLRVADRLAGRTGVGLPWIREETGVDLLPSECQAADRVGASSPKTTAR